MECAWNFVIHALRNADNVQYQYALWHMLHTAIFVSVFVACHRNPCRTMDACKNRHHRLLASSLLLLPYVNGWCSSFQFSSAHYAKRNQSCRRRKQHRVIVPLLSFVLHFANQKTTFSALEKNQKNFLISQKYIYGNILHYFSDCMTDIQIMPIILTEERMWHQTKIQIFVHFTHALFVTGYEFLFLYYETQFFVVCICLRLEYSMHILSFMDMRMLHSIISKSCMMAFFNQFHLFLLPGNNSTLSFDTFVPVLFAICCGSIINSSKSSKHATFSRQDARVPDNIWTLVTFAHVKTIFINV